MVDVIWQGILAPHAVDMKKYFNEDGNQTVFPAHHREQHCRRQSWSPRRGLQMRGYFIIAPIFLKNMGIKEPPKTWEELTEMAKKIQDGERAAGKGDFAGFVFQGKSERIRDL